MEASAAASATRAALVSGQPPDLRMVGIALATWLSAYGALHTRAPVALAAGGVAMIAVAGLWRWAGWPGGDGRTGTRAARPGPRRPGVWAGIAIALLLGVVCGTTATAARLVARDHPAVVEPARRHATVATELTLRRDPRQLRSDPTRPPAWLVPAWLHLLTPAADSGAVRPEVATGWSGPVRVRVRILVLTGDPQWQSLRPGQRVRVTGRLAPARGGDLTAAVLSTTGPPEPLGRPPWFQRGAGSLRDGLQAAAAPLPPEPGGLLPGLAVGDVSNLDPGLSDDFFTTGMTHLVAVSGANVAIVVGMVFLLARAARAPPWLTAGLSAAAVVGFVILCRADASVLRAGVMGSIALVALASGRPRAAVPALAATVTLLVVADPQLAGDPGFALSVLATGGLLLLAPGWRDALRRRGVPTGLAEALVIPAAAQVSVAPLIAGLSGTVSLVAIAANLVATPAVAPATILGVLAAMIAPIWLPGGEFLAWLGSWPAWWLVQVSRIGARAPAAVVPWPAGATGAVLLAALTVALLAAARRRVARRLIAVIVAAVVVGALPVRTVASGWPPAGAVVVACAVGQGDLVVMPLRRGEAIVVDAGPDPAAADRCLRDLRIRSIPLLLVSHFHADHIGGLSGAFRDRDVAAVLTTAWPEPASGRALVAEAAAGAGAPVQAARRDAVYRVGEVSLTVLGLPFDLRDTRSDPNNNSLVVRAEVRGVTVLLTGDAEVELQQALLAGFGVDELRADVLKLPHHGSAYQEPAFLATVAPSVALVPVGPDNPYGHPHPALLTHLGREGVRVLRTDTQGDVAAVRRDGGLAVVTRPLPPSPR